MRETAANAGLERLLEQVQEIVLYLRDEGHVLSPMDQHYIERWWESGFPPDAVLRAVFESGRKLKSRKRPPRGLPLRALNRAVERAGARARLRSVGAPALDRPSRQPEGPSAARGVTLATASVERCLLERDPADVSCGPLLQARARLRALQQSMGRQAPHEALADLLMISREYYDALLEALEPAANRALREGILAALPERGAMMDPEAREQTVLELSRRGLRARDDAMDPRNLGLEL
jgi:hypothetical protein